ncbi:MlaD family protein [Tenacibaculum jejuense]|uniref:Mce/MlaD domain-containing protein n=1 Tax=Tenacibaculum jejuense TaxID=584609 RepID=A0A238U927_9FLAO|nr:MlaD family protein [Tenacibaculum jejuense]SNR15078.1 conserved protein of unknown function [Tenacibaculum jejuense]
MSKELKTGIITLLIIALGIWGYNFLKRQDVFKGSARHFFVEYDNINGLSEASIVTINGLQVGKVDQITFNTNPEKKGSLLVKFSLQNNFEFSNKSIAKIYPAGLMGGQNLAIIPDYTGEMAVSGDYLVGEIKSDLFSAVGEKFNPIQSKLENVLVHVDSLVVGFNQTLNKEARNSLNRSILGFEGTVYNLNKTMRSINKLLEDNKVKVGVTLDNTKKITENVSKITEDLAKAELGKTIKKLENTIDNANGLLLGMKEGKGTLGKLVSDDKLYTNLANATKEMEELLREMKLNPKRFVHFSLFGKKPKPYNEENNKKNVSNDK